MFRFLPAVPLLLAVASPAYGQASATIPIDDLVEPLIRSGKNVAIVVGLVDGTQVSIHGYGRLRKEVTTPPDARTMFDIGSISKVFTSIILAKMVRDGIVALDDPVSALLPPSVRVPQFGERRITLRHLAMHSSALPDMPTNLKARNMIQPVRDYTVANLYEFLSSYRLKRAPGTQADYSTLGFALLGHALSLRAGAPYESLLRQHVTEPLGLADTVVTVTPEQQSRTAQGYAKDGKPVPNWITNVFTPGGGIRSSAANMVRFLAANIDPATAGSLSDVLVHAQHPPATMFDVAPLSRRAGMPIRPALAWFVSPFKKPEVDTLAWFGGSTNGYKSNIGFLASRRAGVVLLSTGVSVRGLFMQILDRLSASR